MAPAASQSYGRTAGENRGPWGGGTASKIQTGGEEARRGERDARAGKLVGDKELGAGESRRGERGRYQGHQWKGKSSNPNLKGQSLVTP